MASIDGTRLVERLRSLGEIGRDSSGSLTRLALSDQDKAGRDLLVSWMGQAGLAVHIDGIGNIFGLWPSSGEGEPIMIGSHIDTVIDAGIYDGCYGVLAGLGVVEAIQRLQVRVHRPILVAAFTNEEGVRYQPDMMGSLVYTGGLDLETAYSIVGTDGSVVGEELARIGYRHNAPDTNRPTAYLELHIEQGPVLEAEGFMIGAVENLQGISWQRITIKGVANHAGTTPLAARRDAGLAAARTILFLRDELMSPEVPTVATVGTIRFEPDAINIVPASATFTVDLRDPEENRLKCAERQLSEFLVRLAREERIDVAVERLARFEPVAFDQNLVGLVEAAATGRKYRCRRMTSGAGHDAQLMARICSAAMIFVPSRRGVSHSPAEHTETADLVAGANVLLDVVIELQNREDGAPR